MHMRVEAPAKLNLSLRIPGKREDGFHEVETLMVRLPGLADDLTIEAAGSFGLEVEGGRVEAGPDNLVTRAVRAFEDRTGTDCRYRVRLEKRIPAGAGLGGGSSDAAAMLKALNELEETALLDGELRELGAGLGSDVPFFLGSGPCLCRGRGEIIEPAETPPLEVLLLKPAFGVSTAEAYRRWASSKPLAGVRYEPQEVAGLSLVNDLERPVYEKYRFLAEVKCWLREQIEVRAALMSGSGAAVFAVLHEAGMAEGLARRARRELDPGMWWWAGRAAGSGE